MLERLWRCAPSCSRISESKKCPFVAFPGSTALCLSLGSNLHSKLHDPEAGGAVPWATHAEGTQSLAVPWHRAALTRSSLPPDLGELSSPLQAKILVPPLNKSLRSLKFKSDQSSSCGKYTHRAKHYRVLLQP